MPGYVMTAKVTEGDADIEVSGSQIVVAAKKIPTKVTIEGTIYGELLQAGYCDCGGICHGHEPRMESISEKVKFSRTIDFQE